MSDMPEINPDDANTDKHAIVYLPGAHRDQALIKANRFLLMLVTALTAAVFLLGLVLLPRQNLLNEIQKNQAVSMAYATQNPALSAEISALKGQLFGLVSGSIESKLRSLEDNIKRGSVADSLDTIRDLKGDVKILASYSGSGDAASAKPGEALVVNQVLVQELEDIKDLIYLTFVSCGLMIAAVAGVWLRGRRRLPSYRQSARHYLSRD
ncbi:MULTISPECIES: hypothetical protein [Methylomonas]|uniref:Uncharacterized protein n=1 Tax=Methylomonas koyamae TaxID=702114 RepID=A0A177NNQ5_9GAMM|nr:hypothetical protein [Methylomonas koyamae]OAI19686.1 hypothetical protein A1355_04075 [Methylomonas koyamae]